MLLLYLPYKGLTQYSELHTMYLRGQLYLPYKGLTPKNIIAYSAHIISVVPSL